MRAIGPGLALLCSCAAATGATVAVDPTVRHQTIIGWGGTANVHGSDALREQILDVLVNDLGLTGQRLEPPSGNRAEHRRWEFDNDDADPRHIRWEAFATAALDRRVAAAVAPFRRLVEARGEPYYLYVSPSFFDGGSSGSAPPWLLNSPDEYAEYAIACLLHLKNKHGIVANAWSVCNEAGNNNAFNPQVVARMIRALGPRLAAEGLPTRIQFSEGVNSGVTWRYIQAVKDDPEVMKHIAMLSYHLYGDRTKRPLIRDFARERKLPTAQTEFMGTRVDDLYDDLTDGGVSYWEHYVLCGHGNQVPSGCYLAVRHDGTSLIRYGQYWRFRQVMHYVRPGAVRIETRCDDTPLRALAFLAGDKATVVLLNTAQGTKPTTATVAGLPQGSYGTCRAVGNRPYQELGVRNVDASGRLDVQVPADAVLTLYPHAGANTPPTLTAWDAAPSFLTLPAARTMLTAEATDAEGDKVAFTWSVKAHPPGAEAKLATPTAAKCEATGLSRAGDYVFEVAASDGTATSCRQVFLRVHAANQPPVIVDLHNRIPVEPTAAGGATMLRAHAWDLEGDPLTFLWTVVSQPAGANAQLDTPEKPACKVTGMTVAGDYIFQFEAKDPTHAVDQRLTVPVRPR
ncbi:MAG: hypothetical protein FJ290_12825 [Planctomycetes bacterium]|nr:hypothetical protein [Planctomycetota bacterium]